MRCIDIINRIILTVESIYKNMAIAKNVKLQSFLWRIPPDVVSLITTGRNKARGLNKPGRTGGTEDSSLSEPSMMAPASSTVLERIFPLESPCPRYCNFALDCFSLDKDSGNKKVVKRKFIKERQIAIQKTSVTLFPCNPVSDIWASCSSVPHTSLLIVPMRSTPGIPFLMIHPPINGPTLNPRKNTPLKREKIVARDPAEVQSDIYDKVADWSVDHPPSRPSIIGAMTKSLWPCAANAEPGVATRMNVRSLK